MAVPVHVWAEVGAGREHLGRMVSCTAPLCCTSIPSDAPLVGSADTPEAKQFGTQLLDAQAWTKFDNADSVDPNALKAKQDKYKEIANKLGPTKGYFTGSDGSRTGAGFLGPFQGIVYSLFQLFAKLGVLLAQVLLRIFLLATPLISDPVPEPLPEEAEVWFAPVTGMPDYAPKNDFRSIISWPAAEIDPAVVAAIACGHARARRLDLRRLAAVQLLQRPLHRRHGRTGPTHPEANCRPSRPKTGGCQAAPGCSSPDWLPSGTGVSCVGACTGTSNAACWCRRFFNQRYPARAAQPSAPVPAAAPAIARPVPAGRCPATTSTMPRTTVSTSNATISIGSIALLMPFTSVTALAVRFLLLTTYCIVSRNVGGCCGARPPDCFPLTTSSSSIPRPRPGSVSDLFLRGRSRRDLWQVRAIGDARSASDQEVRVCNHFVVPRHGSSRSHI